MTKHVWILLIAVVLMVGCEGPMGPTGPEGPQGLAGSAGQDFQFFRASTTVALDGTAAVLLPVGAGTSTQAPLINCYMGSAPDYSLIGTDVNEDGTSVGIIWRFTYWAVYLTGGVPGQEFWVVAAW